MKDLANGRKGIAITKQTQEQLAVRAGGV